jgi:DNA-binding PadR family transcriptional regulator
MSPRPNAAARDLDERARALVPLSPVAYHVLLALADRNRHGLGIAAQVDAATGGNVALGPGTLYGAIKRLLDLDLINDTDDAPDDDRRDDPRRRYYAITALGRRVLALETAQLANVLKVARAKRVM